MLMSSLTLIWLHHTNSCRCLLDKECQSGTHREHFICILRNSSLCWELCRFESPFVPQHWTLFFNELWTKCKQDLHYIQNKPYTRPLTLTLQVVNTIGNKIGEGYTSTIYAVTATPTTSLPPTRISRKGNK